MPPIWFLRHGETLWNSEGRIQGRRDSDLTALGRAQAQAQSRALGPILRACPDCTILCSPLGRALQTAELALGPHGRSARPDPRLMEIDTGAWEGMTRAAIRTDWPELTADLGEGLALYAAAPGGEGLAGLTARVDAVLADLDGPCILISHGLWGQVLRGRLLGLSGAQMGALSNLQGVIYALESGTERVIAP